MKTTTVLIHNTVSKKVTEKVFKSKKDAKIYINRMGHYNSVNSSKLEYYTYK